MSIGTYLLSISLTPQPLCMRQRHTIEIIAENFCMSVFCGYCCSELTESLDRRDRIRSQPPIPRHTMPSRSYDSCSMTAHTAACLLHDGYATSALPLTTSTVAYKFMPSADPDTAGQPCRCCGTSHSSWHCLWGAGHGVHCPQHQSGQTKRHHHSGQCPM